jgi:hypothetical protein
MALRRYVTSSPKRAAKLLFIFLTLIPVSSFAIQEAFQEQIESFIGVRDSVFYDPEMELFYEVKTYRGEAFDTLRIQPLSTYVQQRLYDSAKELLLATFKDSLKASSEREWSEGLIPDFEIPLTFPKGLSFIGEGGRLKIDGKQEISFGGRTDYWTDELSSEYGSPSKFPQLEMDQKLQVKLTGTVGEKISVLIDHDSERENQLKNKVSLRYTGDEDEIIQSIEAGDTDLSLPSTQYTGFSGGGRSGLFGIKAEAMLGGLRITTVATREQGETQSKSISPTATEGADTVYDISFQRRKYYYIEESDSIVDIQVFYDDRNASNDSLQNATIGQAFFYYPGSHVPDSDTTFIQTGKFVWLEEGDDYIFYRSRGAAVLELHQSLQSNYVLGLYYVTDSGDTIGNVASDTLKLRLIKPDNFLVVTQNPQTKRDSIYRILWDYEMKNVYSLGASRLLYDQLSITIFKDSVGVYPDGENGQTYLQILGLDVNGDGRVEIERTDSLGRSFRILDLQKGLLYFPSAFPFADPALSAPDSIIYWKKNLQAFEGKKYFLVINHSQRSDIISLGSFNIIEGSEVVTAGGRALVRGQDYQIDYETGIITLLNDTLDPTARLDISYDYAPFLSLKQKSLVGTRLEYEHNENIRLGSTWLIRSEGTIDERPAIGEEPIRNVVGELDFDVNTEIPPLTRFLDALPLIHTDQPSTMTLQGEIARNFPNPNTKGEGYLDDMEATKLMVDLPISRTSWIYGSVPLDPTGFEFDTSHLADTVIWATPVDLAEAGDIYPNLSDEEANDLTSVLLWIVSPRDAGDTLSWASLNSLVSKYGTDFTNMDFLEVFIKGDGMKLNVDLGYEISEDAVWRRRDGRIVGFDDPSSIIHNEDRNGDRVLDVGEDTGLDLEEGDDDSWTPSSGDDGWDDFEYSTADKYNYERINGTERNQKIDSEDLDNDNFLSSNSTYFEYTIDLDDTTDINLMAENEEGWKHYRVPLKTPTRVFGDTVWDQIRFARVWLSGFDTRDTVMIAKMEINGNKWTNMGITVRDTNPDQAHPITPNEEFAIGVVNNKETSDYEPPPGVRLRQDTRGNVEREQSLALVYTDLGPGHEATAQRSLYDKIDVLDYSELQLFVRPRTGTAGPYPEFYYRIGAYDTTSYYEYRLHIVDSDWTEISIPMDSLTQFKKALKDSGVDMSVLHRRGPYGVKGNPSLTDVKSYRIGLSNVEDTSITGEVWVDEIRAAEPRREGGLAMRGSFNLGFADVARLSLSYNREEANFQKLTEDQRSRGESNSYTLNSSLNLDSFLPRDWGFSIPLSYSWSESRSYPKFLTGSDILLSENQREEEKSHSFSSDVSARFSKRGSKFKLFQWFIDPFSLRAQRRISQNVTPNNKNYTENYSGSLSYSYRPTISNPLKILGKQIYYLPSSYSFTVNYSDQYKRSFSRTSQSTSTYDRELMDYQGSVSYSPVQEMNVSYSLKASHDLRLDTERRFGREINHSEQFSWRYGINLFKIITPSFTYSANYDEDHSPEIQPDSTSDVRNVNQSSTISVNFPLELARLFRAVGRIRDETKDTLGLDAGPFQWLFIGFEKLSQVFGSPQLNYSTTRSSNLHHLGRRPELAFRLGFKEAPDIEGYFDDLSNRRRSDKYSLSGRLNISVFGLGYGGEINETKTYSLAKSEVQRTRNFPKLDLSVRNLEKVIPFGSSFLSSASLNSSYTRSYSSKGEAGAPSLLSRNWEEALNPSLSMSFNFDVGLSLGVNWTKRREETYGFNATASDWETKGGNLSLDYSFRKPRGLRIPLIGIVLNLKSEVSMNLKVSLTEQKQFKSGIVETDKQDFSLQFGTSYSFSRNVTGRLNFDYKTSHNRKVERTRNTIGLMLNVVFKF